MKHILAGMLFAGIAGAITINGPSDIGNTEASITVPGNIMDTVGVGGTYADADTDLYDQTFTYTVTGGTGTGYLFFNVNLFATPFDFTAAPEVMNSFSWVISPFQLITPPGDYKQGSVPLFCGGGVGLHPCTLQFEFGVPQTVRWRVRSTVSYQYARLRLTDIARLRGQTIAASSNIELWGVGTFSEPTGWNLIQDAVVTIEPVPEPGGAALAGAALAGIALRGGYLNRVADKRRTVR